MSLSSESTLSDNASITKVIEIIELLSYKRVKDDLKIPERIASFMWYDHENYESFVGVELDIYRKDGIITVETRTRAGRSYWDLKHQNKTIKYLKDFLGGNFITDDGKNRYLHLDRKPPSKLESGLFISRWICHNALIKPKIYLDTRNIQAQIGRTEPTGLEYLDQMNPRLFSNNLLIPYIVAVWENYLKSSFVVLLKCAENRDKVLKNARFSVSNLEDISSGNLSIEEAIVEGLSFQRPKIISENFKTLDEKIDIFSTLKNPYKKRKQTLFDSIDEIITLRNEFVHTGSMSTNITDKKIMSIINDFEAAVDRIYDRFGEYYKFTPSRDF